MKVIDCGDYKIVILQTPSDDESAILSSYSEDNLIYVPLKGIQAQDFRQKGS